MVPSDYEIRTSTICIDYAGKKINQRYQSIINYILYFLCSKRKKIYNQGGSRDILTAMMEYKIANVKVGGLIKERQKSSKEEPESKVVAK